MTVKKFTLPDVGEGIAEAELVRWLVEPGDDVAEDQPVADVETDKAIVQVPSPYTGTVEERRADEGDIVPVGSVLVTVRIGEDGAGGSGADSVSDRGAVNAEEPAENGTNERAAERTHGDRGRTVAPPSVRRFAREKGVDLTRIAAARSGGRLTKDDVRSAVERTEDAVEPTADRSADRTDGAAEPTVSATSSGGATVGSTAPAGRSRTLARPNTRRIARENGVDIDDVPTDERRDGNAYVTEAQVKRYARDDPPAQEPAVANRDARASSAGVSGIETRPYRGTRRVIGERMSRSKFTAPHVTHHDTGTIAELVKTRRQLSAAIEERGGSLTYLPFVLKSVVAALKRHPILNSRLAEDDEEIRLLPDYHIGIAVATDGGLVVPVIENVDEKGVATLAEELDEVVDRARSRDLEPDELRGGTFTLTNFGAIGGEYGTPIINYPEAAILGLGAIDERAVVEDGEVVARPTLPLSLSFDHRVIDGADAASFTNTVMRYLEQPSLLLVED